MKDLEQEKLKQEIFKQAQSFYQKNYWGILSGEDIKIYQAGSLFSGQIIKIYLRLSSDDLVSPLVMPSPPTPLPLVGEGRGSGVVVAIKAQIYGGPYLMSAAGYFCEFVLNKNLKEILEKFSMEIFFHDLKLPENKKSILLLLEDLIREFNF